MPLVAETRLDPYKNYKFRLLSEGRSVGGFQQLHGASLTLPANYRAGGDAANLHKSPGRSKYEAITLERGLTQDLTFHNWASQVSKLGAGPSAPAPLPGHRKDLWLEITNDSGVSTAAYKLLHAWVSRYQALPRLTGGTNEVAIEHIEISHEGLVLEPASRRHSH